jgi:hypothetical protein
VTVSDQIGADVLALIRAEAQQSIRQDGEYEFAEICILLGLEKLTRNRRETIVRKLVEAGKLGQRKPANVYFYRFTV